MQVKLTLTKALYQAGYNKQDILNLFHFIDWMLNLPKTVEQQFSLELDHYEEQQKMRYVTSIERLGIEKGIEKGQVLGEITNSHQYILDILALRFQQIPEDIEATLQQITDLSVLSLLHKEAVIVESLEFFKTLLTKNCEKLSSH